jgi:hypothetical protein
MVYNTQNYWGSRLCPSSETFWKMDLFSFSGEGRKMPTLLGPLESGPVIEVSSI